MMILGRILRHTFRFPLLSGLSLVMAVVSTALVLVLPGVTMRFVDVIIGKNRPDLIFPPRRSGSARFSQGSSCSRCAVM